MVRKYLILAISLVFLLSASAATAATKGDGVSVTARADKKAVFIGETFHYTIDVSSRRELDIQWPGFKDLKIGDFEIKDSGKRERKGLFGRRTYSRWYVVAGYAIGKHMLPSAEISYRRKGVKDWSKKGTDEVLVSVVSVLPKGAKISDIRDIKGPLRFFEMPWFWICLVVGLVGLTAAGIFIAKKIQDRMRIRPAHEIALKELARIREFLSKSGEVKETYFRISACVRSYIEARFELRAPEMTTEEFLASLQGSGALSDGQKKLLAEFLEACDMVKFARYSPQRDEIESVFTTAAHFIEETKAPQAPKGK